jgi:hypothetical protein
MNAPALSLAFIGLYLFYLFYKTSRNKYLYMMAGVLTLSGMLKVSSLLSFAAIVAIFFIELIKIKITYNRKVFPNPKQQFIPLAGVIVVQVIWYLYARYYNSQHNAGVFLVGILPVWDFDFSKFEIFWRAVTEHIKWDYFRRETQVVFILMLIATWISARKANRLLLLMTSIISVGFIAFLILFFQALQDHDYYVLDLLVLAPFVMMTFLMLLKENYSKVFNSLIFKIIVLAFLIHNIDFARRRIEDRYSMTGWQNHDYVEFYKNFEDISPYLRSLGIEQNDKVLSLSDESINISLLFMNQKGWSDYGISHDISQIDKAIKSGAKYLLIDEQELDKNHQLRPYLQTRIGHYKSIDIYKIQ